MRHTSLARVTFEPRPRGLWPRSGLRKTRSTHQRQTSGPQGIQDEPFKKKRRSLLSGRRRGGSFQPPIIGS